MPRSEASESAAINSASRRSELLDRFFCMFTPSCAIEGREYRSTAVGDNPTDHFKGENETRKIQLKYIHTDHTYYMVQPAEMEETCW
jgi:hypothetical protein